MKTIQSSQKAKIVISTKLAAQIECLHNQCPTGKEWSGLLVFEVVQGSIEDISNLKIRCHDIFLMDFGDATFTSFTADTEYGAMSWLKFFEKFPQISPLRTVTEENKNWFFGKIHSHHSMNAFHSPTDSQDLYENAPKLPFFLSLVVNYDVTPFAEIAVAGESEEVILKKTKWKLKQWKIQKKDNEAIKEKNQITYIIPCNVVYEQAPWFLDRLTEVREEKDNSSSSYSYVGPYTSKYTKDSRGGTKSKEYLHILNCVADLISLGQMDDYTTPYQAMSRAGDCTPKDKVEAYKKAVKMYFSDYWFDYHCVMKGFSEEIPIIEAVLQLTENYKQFLAKNFNDAMNELKEEYKQLRTV